MMSSNHHSEVTSLANRIREPILTYGFFVSRGGRESFRRKQFPSRNIRLTLKIKMEKLKGETDEVKRSKILDELMEQVFANGLNNQFVDFKGTRLPAYYLSFVEAIENFKIRDDDIFVCSYPKAGTTWTQEMVWCISNDLDFEAAKVDLNERFRFLEDSTLADPRKSSVLQGIVERDMSMDSVKLCEALPSPRFIKTHLPFHLLPRELREGKKGAKIIYVQRNAKDTCISYYHHCKLIEGYDGDFELFCELFLSEKIIPSPFWGHLLGYWSQRKNPDLRILYLKYEEMKTDLPSVIRRTSEFLEKPMSSTEKLGELVNHLSFSNMRDNPSVNKEKWINIAKKYNFSRVNGNFIRCGQVGQWKSDMTPEMIEKFDEWTAKNSESFDSLI